MPKRTSRPRYKSRTAANAFKLYGAARGTSQTSGVIRPMTVYVKSPVRRKSRRRSRSPKRK